MTLEQKAGQIQRGAQRGRSGADPLRQSRLFPCRAFRVFPRRQDRAGSRPLRDGMNLVAKEYVAAQNPLDPGVLICRAFAGARAATGGG